MKDKKKWIIGISACVLLMVSVFFVFNQGKSNEQVVTEYFELLNGGGNLQPPLWFWGQIALRMVFPIASAALCFIPGVE